MESWADIVDLVGEDEPLGVMERIWVSFMAVIGVVGVCERSGVTFFGDAGECARAAEAKFSTTGL